MSRTIKKPYTKGKAVSKHCRNSNGKCLYCLGNRTYKNAKRLLASLFMLAVITSCGKRTTSNQSTYNKTDSLSVENSRILSQNIRLNDLYTLVPFDPLKPMIIDGKHYFNVSIRYDKSKFEDFKIEENTKIIEIKKENKSQNKTTEKKDNSNLWIGIVFVAGILIIIFVRTGR